MSMSPAPDSVYPEEAFAPQPDHVHLEPAAMFDEYSIVVDVSLPERDHRRLKRAVDSVIPGPFAFTISQVVPKNWGPRGNSRYLSHGNNSISIFVAGILRRVEVVPYGVGSQCRAEVELEFVREHDQLAMITLLKLSQPTPHVFPDKLTACKVMDDTYPVYPHAFEAKRVVGGRGGMNTMRYIDIRAGNVALLEMKLARFARVTGGFDVSFELVSASLLGDGVQ